LTQKLPPSIDLHAIPKEEAKKELLQRYVTTFGPVTLRDIVWWTGLKASTVRNVLQSLTDQLCRLKVNGLDGTFWMPAKEVEELMAMRGAEEVGLELLPYEDLYLKGYKDRGRFVEAGSEHIFYSGSSAAPSILLNGRLIGLWSYGLLKRERVTFKLITDVNKEVLSLIEAKLAKVKEFLETLRKYKY